jgi:hypothetical protein
MDIYENLCEFFLELGPQMSIIKNKYPCIFQFILH